LDAFFHILLHILYLMHSTSPLHFHYSSIELQNGSIHNFLVSLDNKDIDALQSYQYELGSCFLQDLHQIPDTKTYLSKMQLFASSNVNENENELSTHTYLHIMNDKRVK